MKSYSVTDGLMIFKALGSPVRVKILRLIQEKEGLNIKQLAQNLQLPVTLCPLIWFYLRKQDLLNSEMSL